VVSRWEIQSRRPELNASVQPDPFRRNIDALLFRPRRLVMRSFVMGRSAHETKKAPAKGAS
jgi:hypothetical protein